MRAPLALLGLCLTLAPAPARAAIPLCLEVRAAATEAAGLRRLVLDQLGHHPTHVVIASGCASRLQVELIGVAGQRYLTARMDDEVPTRYPIEGSELADRLAEALQLILGSDPVHLARDVSRYSALQRLGHSLLQRGRNRYRLELFQTVAASGRGATFAPGGALAFTRGADHWQVLARVYLAGLPGEPGGTRRRLRLQTGTDAGLTYELSARGSATLYLSAAAGFQLLRYTGRIDPADRGSVEEAQQLGFTLSGRAGARFFRVTDFDLDLFVTGYLPLFKTRDPDTELIDHYTPSLQLGLGVGF